MGQMRQQGEQQELPEQQATVADDSSGQFQGMMQQQAANRQQQINQRMERQGMMGGAYGNRGFDWDALARYRMKGRRQEVDNPFSGLLSQLAGHPGIPQGVVDNINMGVRYGYGQQRGQDGLLFNSQDQYGG